MGDKDLTQAVIGTKICVPKAFSRNFEIVTVTALTRTNLVCGNKRIRKSDGLVVGSGSGWHRCHASVATPEDIFKHRVEVAQYRVREIKVNAGNLKSIEALLEAASDILE